MTSRLVLLWIGAFASVARAQSPGTFTATGSMTKPRSFHTATLLNDGKVLIAGGGSDNSAEPYDPSTGTFTPTGSMTTPRTGHSATLLPDGTALIAGGSRERPGSAEIYDPTSGNVYGYWKHVNGTTGI